MIIGCRTCGMIRRGPRENGPYSGSACVVLDLASGAAIRRRSALNDNSGSTTRGVVEGTAIYGPGIRSSNGQTYANTSRSVNGVTIDLSGLGATTNTKGSVD